MSGSTQRAIALALGLSAGMMLSGLANAAWYVGLGGGMSKLSPDTAGSPFTLDRDSSQSATGYFGLDINDWLSAEAAFTDLGTAGLSGQQEISYSAISVGGIAYVYGNRGMSGRQGGLSGYVRLGLNSITNESQILLSEADSTAIWIGAGVQYPIGERLGLRAEVASYDGDAQVALASIYWRSKDDAGRRGGSTLGGDLPPIPATVSSNDAYANSDEVEPYGSDDGMMKQGGDGFDSEIMGSSNSGFEVETSVASSAECNLPAVGEPTDPVGCALFTGVVEGVEFQAAGSALTPDSEYILESLALSLNNHPTLLIELQVHSEAFAEQGRAMQVSRERVLTVARFLANQGVNVQRLRARAFGSAEPRFENNSIESRRLNNRIELRVL